MGDAEQVEKHASKKYIKHDEIRLFTEYIPLT
jgi:hypothetical protein